MLAARISGDRFAVFMPEATARQPHTMSPRTCATGFEKLSFVRGRQHGGRLGELWRRGRRRRPAPAVARAGLRGDRLQGRQGSWSQPGRGLRRRRPEHRAALHRPDPDRHRALRFARPPLPARGADDRAAERRAGDAEIRTAAAHERREQATASRRTSSFRRPSAISSRRPSTAGSCDACIECCSRTRGSSRSSGPASRSTSPASRWATRNSRCSSTRRCATASCR